MAILRKMIWLYFALLLTEGALRKWIFPALTAPLLVIRDPLVLLIYIQAVRCRRFPTSGPVLICFLLVASFILLALVQILAGIGGGPLVAVYGLRTNFLHLPLIFLIPKVFSFSDVVKVGKWVLWLSIPMAALMIWQFLSPPDSWINAATMADSQQISFVLGKVRPAGIFSFATGAAHFFVLTTAFLIYGLVEKRSGYSRWLLAASLLSVILVQPVSGSRTLIFGCALIAVATAVFALLNWRRSQRIFVATVLIGTALGVLSFTSFFRESVDVFMVRWDATASEDSTGRVLGWFIDPFTLSPEAGLLGKGVGMGTNAASAMLTGTPQFLLAENEWARVVLEAGPLLGFSFLAYRVWVGGSIALQAAMAARQGQLLTWLLAWDACRSIINEQLSPPTQLGFMVFVSGLCLAAMCEKRSMSAERRAATATLEINFSPCLALPHGPNRRLRNYD